AQAQGVSFFKGHLRPTVPLDSQQITQFVKNLDADEFAIRKQATQELENLHERVGSSLREALRARAPPRKLAVASRGYWPKSPRNAYRCLCPRSRRCAPWRCWNRSARPRRWRCWRRCRKERRGPG